MAGGKILGNRRPSPSEVMPYSQLAPNLPPFNSAFHGAQASRLCLYVSIGRVWCSLRVYLTELSLHRAQNFLPVAEKRLPLTYSALSVLDHSPAIQSAV